MLLSLANLELILDDVLTECLRTRSTRLYELLYLMRQFGFRYNEVEHVTTAAHDGNGNLIWETSKNNNSRLIPLAQLRPMVLLSNQDGVNYMALQSYRTVERFFDESHSYSKITCKGKDIGTHLFRHVYIKNLYANGLTSMQVLALTGLKNTRVAEGYRDSEIQGFNY
jgi:site-specific recombinase XerD